MGGRAALTRSFESDGPKIRLTEQQIIGVLQGRGPPDRRVVPAPWYHETTFFRWRDEYGNAGLGGAAGRSPGKGAPAA